MMNLSASFIAALAALALPLAGASAVEPAAQFDKYPAKVETSSRPVKVRITTAKDRQYASILRESASAKPDFAGHYILASWGCGASCVVSAAIDARDGSVHWFPATVCCWRLQIIEPLEYKLSSRLLIVHGKLNETGNDDDRRYRFVNGKFVLL